MWQDITALMLVAMAVGYLVSQLRRMRRPAATTGCIGCKACKKGAGRPV